MAIVRGLEGRFRRPPTDDNATLRYGTNIISSIVVYRAEAVTANGLIRSWGGRLCETRSFLWAFDPYSSRLSSLRV